MVDRSVKSSFHGKIYGRQDHLTAERLFKFRRIFRRGWAGADSRVSQIWRAVAEKNTCVDLYTTYALHG